MKKQLFILSLAVAGAFPAAAQNEKDSFDTFRKEIKGDFDAFRKKALDDYADYLGGVWQGYNAFRGEERTPLPKPRKAPMAGTTPESTIVQSPLLPTPQPALPFVRKQPDVPAPSMTVENPQTWHTFDFYGLTVRALQPEVGEDCQKASPQEFAALWKRFSNREIAEEVLPSLRAATDACNLNDWFVFELIRKYVDGYLAGSAPILRIALTHYLLVHLGYDVRIGQESGKPLLLVPFGQKVYARAYIKLGGRPYYIFYDSFASGREDDCPSVSTCDIPADVDAGNPIDLLITKEVKMPFSSHSYSFAYGGLRIEGEVNANVMQMLYHYPQMPVSCYAQSIVSRKVHDEVVGQLRRQLQGLEQHKAVDTLLQFVQNAFLYATDGEQHGFEKPYFFEEVLYYPQCDCEDRSVFYSYLLWEVLHVENHLVGYPGHECVAVHLDTPIQGCGYRYKNKDFYISDPTYIGAITGMCMPEFRDERPEVDFSR